MLYGVHLILFVVPGYFDLAPITCGFRARIGLVDVNSKALASEERC